MFMHYPFALLTPTMAVIPSRFALLIIDIFPFHALSYILDTVYPATIPPPQLLFQRTTPSD